jgi:hypothetical protein
MCVDCGCNGVTYPNGSDGIGITSITDNNDGTFTILMSDGSSFTSPSYEGPTGPAGPTGPPSPEILFAQTVKSFSVSDSPLAFNVTTSNLALDGDTLRLMFVYHVNDGVTGDFNITNTPTTGSPENIYVLPVVKLETGIIQIMLTKDGTDLKGYASSQEDVTVDILIENFFNGATSTFTIEADFPADDAWFNNVTLELLKVID